MNFEAYCESILIPFLDIMVDLYDKEEVTYTNALRLGSAMCDIEQCLYDKELRGIELDMVEAILDDFIKELNVTRFKKEGR